MEPPANSLQDTPVSNVNSIVNANESEKKPKKTSQAKATKNLKRRKEESEDDSGSDLEDFIVKDKRYRKMKGEDVPSESESEDEQQVPALPEDGPELAKYLEEEAQQIARNLKSQVVGGRTLRDRGAIKKPQDSQWEKQGKADYQKLMEKDRKKDLLDEIRMWKRDMTKHPEDFDVTLPDDFQWPVLSMKNSLAEVEAGHRQVCDALGLDASDSSESSEDEKSIHTTDSEEFDEDSEEEDSEEDSEDDSEEDSEDDSEEDDSEEDDSEDDSEDE